MKSFDVECPIHGKYELIVHSEQTELFCEIRVDGIKCGERLKKLPSLVNVHYKGSGFYSTDDVVSK